MKSPTWRTVFKWSFLGAGLLLFVWMTSLAVAFGSWTAKRDVDRAWKYWENFDKEEVKP